MNLLSPKSVYIRKSGPFQASFEVSKKLPYVVTENGMKIEKIIETIYISKPVNKFQAKVDAPLVTPENIESYHNFQNLINHCNNNAENLNNQLRDFLLSVKELKQTKEELMAMDFMGLRDVFSDFLKSNPIIKSKEEFGTKAKTKDITSTFYRYIEDRNKYTHGSLKLRFPDEVFVVQYIENRKVKVYAELSVDILNSNLTVSNELRQILSRINNVYNNVETIG